MRKLKLKMFFGGFEADTLAGNEMQNHLFGRFGNDDLFGGGGRDVLFGGHDDDNLFGGDGNDRLFGGLGDDSLSGGAGSDRLHGGRGTDTAVMDGAVGDYTLTGLKNSNPKMIKAFLTDADGSTDRLHGIEQIYFASDDYLAYLDGRNNVVKAADDAAATDADAAVTIDGLTDNDIDFDGDTLTITGIDTTGLVGMATLNPDGTVSYSADGAFDALAEGETAETSFTYTVSDGNGSSDTATVVITVTGVNDAPEITLLATAEVAENTTDVATASAFDIDGDTVAYTLSGDDAALFAIDENGVLTFKNAPDFENTEDADGDNIYDVTVTATDPGGLSDSADIAVTVTDVVEIPVVISELAVSTTGTDWEFLELKGDPGTSLDGLQLIRIDQDGDINRVFDLTGFEIGENGYFLLTSDQAVETFGITGNLGIANNSFTNNTGTYALVQGSFETGTDLDEDDDGGIDTPLTIIDSVAIRDSDEGDLTYSDNVVGPDGSFLPAGVERQEDGTFRITSFFDSDDYSPMAGADLLKISEIAVSTTGTDWEFVELQGEAGTSLDGFQLVQVDGDGDVRSVIDLSGQTIGENGFFLATSAQAESTFGLTGNLSFANNTFTNTSSSFLLIEGSVEDDTDLDADDDGTLDTPLTIVDSVALIDDDGPLVYADQTAGPDGTFLAPGAERLEDGSYRIGSFFDSSDYSPTKGTGDTGGPTFTTISVIQGNVDSSPLQGEIVAVEAVVTAIVANGFYLQEEDADADADATTSEGIFVFTGDTPGVTIGDVAYVTGEAAEFFGFTQIAASTVEVMGTAALPTAAQITLPDSIGSLENFEGMQVSLWTAPDAEPLTIIENFNFDRFGELTVSSGTQVQPSQIYDAQTQADEIAALTEANLTNRITIDDGVSGQNPDSFAYIANTSAGDDGDGILSAGDVYTADGPTVRLGSVIDAPINGVLSYSFGEYKIIPTETLSIDPTTNEGARDGLAPDVGGELTVVSFNALNYFTTLGERGASTDADLARQTEKLVNALIELDGDVVGLQELENNGFLEGSAIDTLVDALNAALGAEVYAYVDPTTDGGPIGTDAITTGIIYKQDVVTLLNADFLVFSDDGQQRNRPATAASFEDENGEVVTIVSNHFKSKGPSGLTAGDETNPDSDQGDGQGFWNQTRTDAAEELAAWLATDPLGTADPDVLILGDLNAYSQEDPIQALEAAGYDNLLELYVGAEDAFSFVFDGQQGALDHALSTESLTAQITGVAEWHINAQEPDLLSYNSRFNDAGFYNGDDVFASSDHDPLVIGLTLNGPDDIILT